MSKAKNATKFPSLIHVTRETAHDGSDAWLQVSENGVLDLDVPGQAVAIYKLTRVGRVSITKAFIDAKEVITDVRAR